MKNLIKIFIFTFSLTFLYYLVIPGHLILAKEYPNTITEISIKKNVIVWRYKSVNGKIYKRKYNITLKNGLVHGLKLL